MSTDTLSEAGLKACPFCGGEPSVSSHETESLWSHNIVTYTTVKCDECDISFSTEPGYEVEAPEAWNRRAYLAATQAAPVAVVDRLLSEMSDRRLLNDVDPSLFDEIAEAIIRVVRS